MTEVLLASCLGEDTGGGLFAVHGSEVEEIDRISSTGLAVRDGLLARALASGGHGEPAEILRYDERGVRTYTRVDAADDVHDLFWTGAELLVASTGTNTILRLTEFGASVVVESVSR